MRRVLTAALAVAVLATSLVALISTAAYADPVCSQTDPATGICLIWVEGPSTPDEPGGGGDDGPEDTGSGAACYWDGTSQGISKPPPGPVPCSTKDGYWSNGYHCYIKYVDPQPGPGDPFWEGVYLDYGAVYQCYQPQTELLILVWSADPPPSSGAGPTPREVAQLAIDQMQLKAIDIGIAPKAEDGSIGLVGMPVWMWVANPDEHTWGPITASASGGGVTVIASARVEGITWEMGDGNTVSCTSAGTPYKASYGNKTSPDCGHVYTTSSSSRPDDKFTVTATSDWVVEWAGAGQTGTIRLDGLTRETQIAVGEAQVLVQ